jgi:hypothetical protein
LTNSVMVQAAFPKADRKALENDKIEYNGMTSFSFLLFFYP